LHLHEVGALARPLTQLGVSAAPAPSHPPQPVAPQSHQSPALRTAHRLLHFPGASPTRDTDIITSRTAEYGPVRPVV